MKIAPSKGLDAAMIGNNLQVLTDLTYLLECRSAELDGSQTLRQCRDGLC